MPDRALFRTPRFALRELTVDDAQQMYELNSDPLVMRYTGNQPYESAEAARSFLANHDHYRRFGMGRWAVEDASGAFLGWCGLKTLDSGEVDLGYRFFRKHWGQGIATETGAASLAYGFSKLGLTEIIATVAEENVASVRVVEKLGMERMGVSRCGSDPALVFKLHHDAWARR